MPIWFLDAALAALALISEIRRRRSCTTRLPSSDVRASYNQPNLAPAFLKRFFLQTPQGQLLYRYSETAGPNAPLLIFLHNERRSSDQFSELIQLCCTRFRCVAPDFLGHGESDKPNIQISVEHFAEHVVLLLDTLRTENAFVFGDSLGAFVAVHLSCKHSSRINRAVLANLDLTSKDLQRLRGTTSPSSCSGGQYMRDAWEAQSKSGSRELNHRCAMDRLQLWGFDLFGERAMVQYWNTLIEYAQDVTCPVMLLWGRENLGKGEAARLMWRKDGTAVERAMPHAEVVYMKGRVCMIEKNAGRVFARIAPFLRDRPVAVVHRDDRGSRV